jgi:type II secretory pathway pseudopilin PulG
MARVTLKSGFTLVEILVATTVIMGLTGLVVANFGSFSGNQKMKQAGKTLKNDLRFVQTRAQSALKPTGCNKLVSYQVAFTQTTYQYQPVCDTGLFGSPTTITVPSGIVFSPIPTAVTFKVLSGIPDKTLQIVMSGSGRTYSIRIDQNGDINDLGFQQ